MAVSYVGKGDFAGGTDAISLTVPSGYQDGDLLLCLVESANEAVTIPSGWTECSSSPIGIGTAGSAGGVRLTMFYKFSNSSESALTVADSGNHTTGIMTCWRGVDSTTPINSSANGFDETAPSIKTFPSVTTTVDDAMIINAIGLDRDAVSTSNLSEWENPNLVSITGELGFTTSSGRGGGVGFAYGVKATAGSTGNTTAKPYVALKDVYITLALTPYVEASDDYTIVGAISQASTIAVANTKKTNLVASITQSSEVSASLTKQTSIVGQVSQDESVVSVASKHIEVVASIEQGSTVYSFVTKEELEKTISASIEQSSSVVASVSKQSDLVASIEQLSLVSSLAIRVSGTVTVRTHRFSTTLDSTKRSGVVHRSYIINHSYLTRLTHNFLATKTHDELGYQRPTVSLVLDSAKRNTVTLNPIYRKVAVKND